MVVGPTTDNTWGAAFIGVILAAILYGITCLQTYIYFTTYLEDGWHFKTMAGLAFALDTTSLGLVGGAMYGYLVTDMDNPWNRMVVNRAFDIEPSVMGLLAFITHLYLGMRRTLTNNLNVILTIVCNRNIGLGILLSSLMTLNISLAFASSVVSWRSRTWIELKAKIKNLALAGIISTVALDVMIATVLCTYLVRQEVEGRKARRLVRRVLFFAINTGLASSVISTLNLAMFLAFPDTMIFLSLTMIYTKVYANALLANLNAREHLRGSLDRCDADCVSLNLSALRTNTIAFVRHTPIDQAGLEGVSTTSNTNQTQESLDKG